MCLQISEASLHKIIHQRTFQGEFHSFQVWKHKVLCHIWLQYASIGPAITTNLFACVRAPLKLLIQIYYYNFIWRRENTATNYFTDSIISHTYVKIPSVSQLYYLNNLSWPRRQ